MLGSYLRTEEFIYLVKNFNDIWIEVKYPSDSYKSIFNSNILMDLIKITVIISDGIDTKNLFKNNHQLISVQFDRSICTIGESTFNGCNKLKEVIFDSNEAITSFNCSAFFRCTSLTHITIPSSVNSILKAAFYECIALRNASFNQPSKLKHIDEYAFNGCKMLSEILIPSSVKEIGDYAFDRCDSLQHISISFFTKKIGKHSFPERLAVSFT